MNLAFLKDQRGSASIEFVILAIPLFIPLFLYMNTFSSVSDDQERLRTLARESVRAFVTSANDGIAFPSATSWQTSSAARSRMMRSVS
jgi:Flp pilus assembly protein TadG